MAAVTDQDGDVWQIERVDGAGRVRVAGASGNLLVVNADGSIATTAQGAAQDTGNSTTGTVLPAFLGSLYVPNVGGAPGATSADMFVGSWFPCANYAAFGIDASSTGLGYGFAEWSDDGGATISRYETTIFAGYGAFTDPPQGATHGRILFQNIAATSNTFKSHVTWRYLPQSLFLFPAAAPINGSFPSALVKAISTGANPVGDYVDLQAGGVVSDNGTTTPLAAGATWSGAWHSRRGYVGITVLVRADQLSANNGIVVQHSDTSTGVVVRSTDVFTFGAVELGLGFFFITVIPKAQYFRVSYTNGGTMQGSFFVETHLETTASEAPRQSIEGTLTASSLALMVRGILAAKNAAGAYGNIERGTLGGLNVAVTEHTVTTPPRPCDSWDVTRVTATTTAATMFTTPAHCTSVEVFNSDNNVNLRINRTAAQVTGGSYRTILPGNSLVLELGPGVTIAGASASSSLSAEFTVTTDSTL